jgi:Dolichyl-phosphate-mannose-protein mannosyltransferase
MTVFPALATNPRATDGSALPARLGEWLARTPVRLGLLLLACAVPRIIVACRLTAIGDDAYSYLHVADSLERGRFTQALEYLNLNVYPVVLVALHKLGLEWTVAGKVWGVLMGTAIAVPLFGWLRRMFDERLATAGVFLYAIHPKLIEFSVEPIREATMWFFFVLGLNLLWRSFEERRWWQFAVAGVALALALHTRIEGWFLLAPLAAWGAVCWWRVPAARMRLALGVLLCLAMTPLLVVALNVTVLARHSQWEFGRLTPFALVAHWVHPVTAPPQSPANAPASAAPTLVAAPTVEPSHPAAAPAPVAVADAASVDSGNSEAPNPEKLGRAFLIRRYLFDFVHTLGVPYLVLTLIGFWSLRARFRDPRFSLLPIWTVATLIAIWVQLAHAGEMNGRYFLTLAFIDAGITAAGLMAVIAWLQAVVAQWSPERTNRLLAVALAPACLLAAGWVQSFTTRHTSRHREAKLGLWAKAHTGPSHRAVSDFQAVRPAYFAAGYLPEVVKYDEFMDAEFDRNPPDLLVIDPHTFPPRLLQYFLDRATDLGLAPLDQQGFSSAPPKFLIYARPTPGAARPANLQAANVPRASVRK